MGKAGEYNYPDIKMQDAIEFVTPIVKKFGGKISRDGFEKEIDKHGGRLSNIIGSLKGYGLLEGRGIYRVTELAQTIILSPLSNEREKAIGKCCLNYEIMSIMYEEFGGNIPEKEAVSVFLKEKIGVDWSEARKNAASLLNLYKGAIPYIKTVIDEVGYDNAPPLPPPSIGIDEIRFGDILIRLPSTLEAVETAKTLLSLQEKRVKSQENPSPSTEEG